MTASIIGWLALSSDRSRQLSNQWSIQGRRPEAAFSGLIPFTRDDVVISVQNDDICPRNIDLSGGFLSPAAGAVARVCSVLRLEDQLYREYILERKNRTPLQPSQRR
jgi:hypothetical protein